MRPSTSRRRTRRLAGIAAVAAVAVVMAGCSSAAPPTSNGKPLPGITANSVKVGYTIVDLGALAKALGFKQPDYGTVPQIKAQIQSVVDYVNQNGGAGGRQIQADIKTYLGSGDSPQQSAAQCNGYTQDDQVFAVALDGGFQNNAVPCYKAANTLVLDETLIAHDQTQFQNNAPYLWSPTTPEYSSFVKSQLTAMNDAKFFDGNTGVLIMPADDEVSRRTTDNVVKPYLSSIGITKMQTSYVDSTNTGTLGATSGAALTAGKNANLNRVVVIGGARIEPVVLSDSKANGYNSTWGISTYDNPAFTENNPESVVTTLRNGMTGIGYSPAQDVNQQQGPAFPDPANPWQQKCYDIVTKAGATPPANQRSNWRLALNYCDATMFLKATLDNLKGTDSVSATQFADAVAKIGATYGSSATFGSAWGPGVFAGTNQAQVLSWDASCQAVKPTGGGCFKYTGTNITFGAAVAPAPGATSAPMQSVPGSAPTQSVPGGGGTVPTASSTLGTVPSTPAGTGGQIQPYATITAN